MSRRDTIIIAALLNAGLLIILFATNLKSDLAPEPPPEITVLASNQADVKEHAPLKHASFKAAPAPSPDQVDQVIQQYVTPQVTVPSEVNPNFLADLEAIGASSSKARSASGHASLDSTVSENKFKEMRVKKGDVLERIARQNQATVSEIMKLNKLTSTHLKIGQLLKIPVNEVSISPLSKPLTDDQYYTVKAGDNPWTIAVKHHIKVEELLRLNDLDEQKAKRLQAGDTLRVK